MTEKIRVLLADDHAVMRDGLRMIVEGQHDMAVVGEAADGREAVDQCRELHPNVVVMDIAMPELNGVDATRQIRTICPGTQVVILSMHAGTEHIYRALHAGALGYVLKEAAGREAVEAVRTVFRGSRYLSRKVADTVAEDYVRFREEERRSPLERLSEREREVLQLVVEGRSSKEIAETLHLSPKTVETYRSRVMEKLHIDNLPGLVKFAIEQGLTAGD